MAIKFSNLASTTLASGVSSTATSVSVTSASSFPALGSGDYFYATIGAGSGSEIVKVTGISGTTFTVSRGEDGTTAVSHSAGVDVALRVTAGTLEDLRDGGQVYTAGSGLGLSGNEFTNTAPDQTVSISGSGSTTVTGTYPSFTVSSTSYSHPSAHPISFITGLQTALDGKVDDSQVLTDVPANALFTDTVYTHPTNHSISFITGLQTALDGKVDDSQVLTDVPSGALFTDTVYTLPFTDNSSNWNTAYGWGDHSTGGYLTSHQSLSGYATETYVGTQISNLVDSSPAALNTLNELAAALGDDPNFATTVSTSIGTKLPLAGGTLTGTLAMGANAITSTGTISSGAITNTNTSGLGIQTSGYSLLSAANNARAASGSLRLGNGAGSTGFVLDYTDQGQTVATIRNAYVASNTSELTIQSPFITFDTGTSYTEALKLDHNQNAIFAGTISSGAITASGDITAASGILTVKPTSGGGGQIGLGDWTNTNPIGISEGLWNTVASDNDYITVYARSSFNIRGYAGGTTHWLAMTGSAFNLVASQALQIGGTTVIDASRNLTNIGTISSGAITSTGNSTHGGYSSWTAGSGTGGIFMHYNASSSYRGYFDWRTLQLGNNGANNVLFGNTSTGGYGRFYVNSTGISQSGGTSGIHAFSMLATGEVVKEANERFTIKSHTNSWAGGMRMISSTGAYTFQIHPDDNGWMYVDQIWNFNGDIKMGNTTIIDSSRNLTNINAITSTGVAALTRGNGSVGAPNTANHDTGTRIELYNSSATAWYAIGIESNTMWFNSDDHYRFYIDAVSKVDFDSSGVVNAVGGYKVNGTTVIDSSRNITAGTISSGAITSTGATSSFGPGSGATYIRIGDQVTDNNPGGWNKGVHLNSLNHGRFRIRTTNYTYGALETYYWADSSVTPSMGIYGNTSTFKFTGSITTLQNSSGNTFFHAGNDGSGSGLDADLLDGIQGSNFLRSDTSDTMSGQLSVSGNIAINGSFGTGYPLAVSSSQRYIIGMRNTSADANYPWFFHETNGSMSALGVHFNAVGDKFLFREDGNAYFNGGLVWHTGNDGSGSGLDADLLDGQQPSALSVNYANTAGSAPANGGTATALNGSHYISRRGGSGNYNTDFTNVPAGAMNHQGDDANSTNNPGGTWWFLDNYRHSNSTNYWGTQVAWGWEDNANTLRQRNVLGGNYSGWVNYWNSGNDGSGSGLDADLLDGAQATSFLRSDAVTTGTTITASDAFRSSRWEDGGGTFLFREASGSGRPRHLNLADTTD